MCLILLIPACDSCKITLLLTSQVMLVSSNHPVWITGLLQIAFSQANLFRNLSLGPSGLLKSSLKTVHINDLTSADLSSLPDLHDFHKPFITHTPLQPHLDLPLKKCRVQSLNRPQSLNAYSSPYL